MMNGKGNTRRITTFLGSILSNMQHTQLSFVALVPSTVIRHDSERRLRLSIESVHCAVADSGRQRKLKRDTRL